MSDREASPVVELLDVAEIVCHLDMCAGLLASAEQSFADISALFEAIVEAAPEGSLMSRLSTLGTNLTENLFCDFHRYSSDFMSHVERYSAAIDGDPFRRVSGHSFAMR